MSGPDTVFLVDDDVAARKGLSRLLRSAGFEVAQFDSARAFLDGNHHLKPGCLVLDVNMPGMSGIELQSALRERRSLVPVIFLSGQDDTVMGDRAKTAGAADFLSKPVDDVLLLAAVRAAIDRNAADRLACERQDPAPQLLADPVPAHPAVA